MISSSAVPNRVENQRLRQEWVALAPEWIKESREGRNPTRNGLLDPPMLEACGDVTGLRVLDCGCGEGRFCRIMVERGAAYALGVDTCGPMIEAAKELQTGPDEYRLGDVEDLSFLDSSSFDLAISYLNQCDLQDFMANTREVYRVLRPGGRFIIANLHPMRSASGKWHRDAEGNKLHVMVDDYFKEGERRWTMMGVEFTNFHRTLSTYITGYQQCGFALESMVEPTVSQDVLRDYPELDDEIRVPNFIIFALRKGEASA